MLRASLLFSRVQMPGGRGPTRRGSRPTNGAAAHEPSPTACSPPAEGNRGGTENTDWCDALTPRIISVMQGRIFALSCGA